MKIKMTPLHGRFDPNGCAACKMPQMKIGLDGSKAHESKESAAHERSEMPKVKTIIRPMNKRPLKVK